MGTLSGGRLAAICSLAAVLVGCAAPTAPTPSTQAFGRSSPAAATAAPTATQSSTGNPSAPPSRTPEVALVPSCARQDLGADGGSSPSAQNVVATPMQLQPIGVLAEPDGSIVVGGIVADGIALAKFLPTGVLDDTFGIAGKMTLVRDWHIKPERAWLGSDGTLISAAVVERTWTVCRFLANGTVDTTFGDEGTASVAAAGGRFDSKIGALAVQTDGSILVAGSSGNRLEPPNPNEWSSASVNSVRFAMIRLTIDGRLDKTFGDQGGAVVTDVAMGRDPLHGLSVLSDGKILASGGTGQMTPGGEDNDAALVRYGADGRLDTLFGVGGKSLTHPHGAAWALATVPSGAHELLMLGQGFPRSSEGWQAFVMRLPVDGASDRMAGVDDIVWFPTLSSSWPAPVGRVGFDVQDDGKLLFVNAGSLHRYNRDGTVDPTFGEDGRVFSIGSWQ
jgi:uncharacterized delta-60 repeat protein